MTATYRDRRRTPPRSHARPRAETFDALSLLAEDVRRQVPEEWFAAPWRDGRNAMALVEALLRRGGRRRRRLRSEVAASLKICGDHPEDYWTAEDAMVELSRAHLSATDHILASMRLRMLQLLLSHSHGGGHGFSALLLRDWHRLDLARVIDVEGLVRQHRCADALGPSPQAARVSAAFQQAWKAGLFRVAYALAPSSTS
mgnify:CR=1 FL=1